jgi:hypothetical protein
MNILETLLQPVVFSDIQIAGMCAVALLTIGAAVFIQFLIEA